MLTFKKFPAWITPDGNKVPIIKDWQKLATDDQEQINKWKAKHGGTPNFIWGIPTGKPNNIYVLDVDVKNGKNGQATLMGLGQSIPNTAWQQTRSGGYHLLFRPNGQVLGNSVGFLEGLDIRGEGGWIADYGIEHNLTPIAEFPNWLYTHIKSKPDKHESLNGEIIRIPVELANKMVADLCEKITTAADGQGNVELNQAAFEAGQVLAASKINEEWLHEQLMKAATKNGRRSARESKATIDSGLAGGLSNPSRVDAENFKSLRTDIKPAHIEREELNLWIPGEFKEADLINLQALRRPQLFQDWLTEDIVLFNASGGTGKTTLKLYEAICMRLGDSFLGFDCKAHGGKTLFVTGEDDAEKLRAMVGQILKQMGLISDTQKVKKILSGIYIKKDTDMQIVTKTPNGWTANQSALEILINAVHKLEVKKVVLDPLSIFWGSEQQVNDMTRGVVKFATKLREHCPNVCFEMIHHLNVDNSKTKDMSQFAGRGGSVIPSHSRIVTTMRSMDDEDIVNVGVKLNADETGILCNVGKFSDGSKLLNKPFVIVRKGYLFRREDAKIVQSSKGKKPQGGLPEELIMNWIKLERAAKRYPSRAVIEAHFGMSMGKTAAKQGLKNLEYLGFEELRIKKIDNPNGESKEQVYVVIDKEGNEL